MAGDVVAVGPSRVCELAGRGLMLALVIDPTLLAKLAATACELRPELCADVPPLLLLHVYLLREHCVRTRPTAGALMLDVPAIASAASIQRVCEAVRALVTVLSTEAFEEVIRQWCSASSSMPKGDRSSQT